MRRLYNPWADYWQFCGVLAGTSRIYHFWFFINPLFMLVYLELTIAYGPFTVIFERSEERKATKQRYSKFVTDIERINGDRGPTK